MSAPTPRSPAPAGRGKPRVSPFSPKAPVQPLWKPYLAFLVPMIGSNLLQAASGSLNNIYVGQMLGVSALAAVTSYFPLMFFMISLIIGLGAGAAVLIGQAFGAGETGQIKAIAATTLSVVVAAGLLVAVFGGTATTAILSLLGTPPDVLPQAVAYARIMLIATPGIFLYLLATSMLRGVGDTITPLFTLGLATLIGMVLTPALIRGWAGLPQMGVTSPAWASIISMTIATTWMVIHLRRRNHPLAPDGVFLRALGFNRTLLAKVLRIGLPTGIMLVLISLSEILILSLVNRFGSDATASYGAITQIVNYVQFPAISIGITASIFGAQAIGAGRTDRLSEILRTALTFNLVLTGSLVVLVYVFSGPLLGLFLADPAVVAEARTLLHIVVWALVIYGMGMATSSLMRASGMVLLPTLVSGTAILAIGLPVGWALSARIGIEGVWMSYPVAFCLLAAGQSALYHLVWKKRPIRRLV
ncbi:MATE family efflux transporter [Tistrella mobilis]|uniref:MATE family efflux transporter n=1 Tax=Tistrella mobilis TaxID=171437 RepID=A0A162KYE8_9PROT|nr:MATE family efflux transporter [Tistrella mobilis]